jgi:hypothetical protein
MFFEATTAARKTLMALRIIIDARLGKGVTFLDR